MIGRFRRIFGRYADSHVTLAAAGQPLQTADGTRIGFIDQMQLRDGRLVLDGWADAQRVTLSQNGLQAQARTSLVREDVSEAYPDIINPTPGFTISLPYRSGPFAMAVESGTDVQAFALDGFETKRVRRQRRRLIWPFLARAAWAFPLAVRSRLTRDQVKRMGLRQRVKARLGLKAEAEGPVGSIDAGLLAAGTAVPKPDTDLMATPITIVLPVYNAFDLLQECLSRVAEHTDLPWHLVVIEDCSTDPQVRPWLKDWVERTNAATPDRVTLIENPQNRGFIGSVNSGFDVAVARGDHVVLLNSDALVPAAWASRLIRPMLTRADVATVTPMSNDAEIFAAPVMCVPAALTPGEADAIDAVAATFDPDASLAEAPTGVGFCMAMHADYLRKIPQLDTVFGRGYGEEVDWCQKARALGGTHLGLGQLYVEHRGGQSFGNAEKMKLIARNNKVISDRYTRYDADVQDFIRFDPMNTSRLALALTWASLRAAGQGHPLPVYMAHDMGGGAEHYLEHRIKADLDGAGAQAADVAVVLRVGGLLRWQLEVHSTHGITRGKTDDFAVVEELFKPLGAVHLVYSNGVGDPDPVSLPEHLLALKRTAQDTVEVLFHDFYPISPSYTLLDTDGRFHDVPAASYRSLIHEVQRPNGMRVKLAEWRSAWGALMDAADRVVVFSKDSAVHVRAAYPDAAPVVVPHQLQMTPDRVIPPKAKAKAPPVIGVLGNIGLQKGAAFLAELGAAVPDARTVVIGNVDPAYDLGPGMTIHGDYQPSDIGTLATHYGVTCWLIPSIWPETFSYTTHECLATGLPVWCFDVGAQAEAVAAATAQGAPGGVLPYAMVDQPAEVVARLTAPVPA